MLSTQDQNAPYRIETGTLNHAALVGVKAAIDYIVSWGNGATYRDRVVNAMDAIAGYEHRIASRYFERLSAIPRVTVWGPDFTGAQRAPTVSITIDAVEAVNAARKLGELGLLVWDGHFYAARAVEVLGLKERGGLLRTGLSMYNTAEEVDRLADAVERLK